MAAKKKISEKADKRRRAKVVVGHDADGDPIIKYASGRTKAELEANKEELKRSHVLGEAARRRDMLFGVYALEWYAAYKEPHLSVSSKSVYSSIFNVHILPELEDRQLRAITSLDLQRIMNGKNGLSSTTLGYIKSILTGVFQSAVAAGVIDRDPTVGLVRPNAKKQNKRALTQDETAAALAVGQEHPEGLLLLVLYYTGARIGEALGLQWKDVDFKKQTVNIRRDLDYKERGVGELKSERSRRSIPMTDELTSALWAVRGIGGTFIFQGPQSGEWLPQATYKRRWARLMEAMYRFNPSIESRTAVVEGCERTMSILTPHYFRHNYASVLYNAGVDILSAQRLLGHADVKTTLSIYSHLADDKLDQNADKVREALTQKARKVAERLPE